MYKKYFKRVLDFCGALLGLILLSPLLLAVMVWLHFANKGAGAFFIQERPGKNAKIFKIIKFKTMTDERDPEGNLLPDGERLTRVGRFVRSTSIDELPQLFNVLKGEMSIVGPRPLLVEYLPYYTEKERHRHDMRPGLTGWAQINGRNVTEWNIRLQQDVYYVNNCNFFLDLKIIILTIHKVINRSDIFVGKEIKVGRLDYARKGK